MKAIANEYAVPAAAVLAIEAGCDGVLICSGDHDTQAAALEALVHAVEDERLPLSRVEDALARQQRAKERFSGGVRARSPALGQDAPRAPRPRRASRHRRRDGAIRVMLKPRALTPGDRLAVVAPASPFTARGIRSGHRRDPPARLRAGLRRLGVRAAAGTSPGSPEVRAAAIHAAWRDPSIAGRHRRPRRLRQRAGAAAARSRGGAARPQAVHRLQRSHVGPDVPDDRLRPRRVSRADAGGAARPGRVALRSRLASARALPPRADGRAGAARRSRRSGAARPPGRCSAARSRSCWRRSARRSPSRRRRATCCFSTRSASGPIGSTAWSRSCGRRACWRARRRSSSASCRSATSRRASRPRRAVMADLPRRLSRPGRDRLSLRPHDRARDDAAARRRVPRRRRRPAAARHRRGGRRVKCGDTAFIFIGICGTAMATLAAMLKHKGFDVRGSDQDVYPPMSDFLAAEGIPTLAGLSRRAHHRRPRPRRRRQRDLARQPSSSRKSSTARFATARCPRPFASTFSGARARSSSPARTARRRRRRWRGGC